MNRPGRHICLWAFLGQPGRLVRVYLFEPGWLVGPPSQVPQPTWYFLAGWWVYLPWYISTAWQVGDGGAPWYIYRRHTHYSRLVDHHQKIDHKTVCMLTLFLSHPHILFAPFQGCTKSKTSHCLKHWCTLRSEAKSLPSADVTICRESSLSWKKRTRTCTCQLSTFCFETRMRTFWNLSTTIWFETAKDFSCSDWTVKCNDCGPQWIAMGPKLHGANDCNY